jgi:hypothetical protein
MITNYTYFRENLEGFFRLVASKLIRRGGSHLLSNKTFKVRYFR